MRVIPSSTSIGLPSMISCLGIAAFPVLRELARSSRSRRLDRYANEEAQDEAGQAKPEQHRLVRGLAGEARGTRHQGADATGAVKAADGVGEARVGAAPGKPSEVAQHGGEEGEPPDA